MSTSATKGNSTSADLTGSMYWLTESSLHFKFGQRRRQALIPLNHLIAPGVEGRVGPLAFRVAVDVRDGLAHPLIKTLCRHKSRHGALDFGVVEEHRVALIPQQRTHIALAQRPQRFAGDMHKVRLHPQRRRDAAVHLVSRSGFHPR